MKVRIKDLPSKKQLKKYYNDMDICNGTERIVTNVDISKRGIYLTCKLINNGSFIAPFYQNIEGINLTKKLMLIRIKPEYFEHVLTNYNTTNEYLEKLAKRRLITS